MRRFILDATSSIATITGNTEIDYVLPSKKFVYGGVLIANNAKFGDYVVCDVCLPDGTVYNRHVKKAYLEPITDTVYKANVDSDYPTNIPGGFILRVTYYPIDTTQREAVITYKLEELI